MQNVVSFIGLFYKRDLYYTQNKYTDTQKEYTQQTHLNYHLMSCHTYAQKRRIYTQKRRNDTQKRRKFTNKKRPI